MNYKTLITILLLTASSACLSDSPTLVGSNPGFDSVDEETETETETETDNDEEKEKEVACVPSITCEDTCGMLDDGCGNALDCGSCECENGVPAAQDCGPCGLGELKCEAGQSGAGTCEIRPELEDASCKDLVFYRYNLNQAGTGTKSDPFGKISEAIDASKGKRAIILAQAPSAEITKTVLSLEEGVHFLGGFDKDFRPDLQVKTKIVLDKWLEAKDLVSPTLMQNIELTATQNAPTDRHRVTVLVSNSPNFSIENVYIEAGPAADGKDGSDGQDGTNGSDGASGQRSKNGEGQYCRVSAARGANGTRNSMCPFAQGGFGGDSTGGIGNQSCSNDGRDGQNIVSAQGGEGGIYRRSSPIKPKTGKDGVDGTPVLDGEHAIGWTESSLIVRGNDGQPGEEGVHGFGGAGGGGGAALFYAGIKCSGGGGGGGAGGAGGCGGTQGTPGSGGYASIALMVRKSGGLSVLNTTIKGANGGNGGLGGDGGLGGNGGGKGRGGDTTNSVCPSSHNIYGGRGGKGGNGSNGGAGGSGSGGPSFSIYCAETKLNLDTIHITSGLGGLNPGSSKRAESDTAYSCD